MLAIRRYQAADHEKVWHLHKLALAASEAYVDNGSWDDDLHHIEQVYIESGGEFLVGVYEGQVVAMGALGVGVDRAEVKRMRVHPDHQRRGFGQAILQQLEQRALELGYKALILETTAQQEAAQYFYIKNGYDEIERKEWHQFMVILYKKELKL
jgi:GNAT superfamily N-acetyltransferase